MARHYRTAIVPARPYKPRDKAKVEVGVQVVGRWILARLRHQRFFSLRSQRRDPRAARRSQRAADARLGHEPAGAVRTARPAGPAAVAGRTLRIRRVEALPGRPRLPRRDRASTTTACRTSCSARRSRRGSPRRRSRSSIAASGSPAISAALGRIGRPPSPSTCRVRIGATATGRTSASAARPPRSAPTPPPWSMSSCARGRIPSRASAPASAFSAWSSAMALSGSTPPAPARWCSARAPTTRSPPS